jgi:hypothetical protein
MMLATTSLSAPTFAAAAAAAPAAAVAAVVGTGATTTVATSRYVYLCLPWVSKSEWHAFSIVMHPTLPNHSCVCMASLGDWTKSVHKKVAKPGRDRQNQPTTTFKSTTTTNNSRHNYHHA